MYGYASIVKFITPINNIIEGLEENKRVYFKVEVPSQTTFPNLIRRFSVIKTKTRFILQGNEKVIVFKDIPETELTNNILKEINECVCQTPFMPFMIMKE